MSDKTDKEDILDTILGDDKKNVKIEFKPGVGVDIGTSNIVVSRQTPDGKFINRFHRNMLYPLEISEDTTDLLEKSDYLYVKLDNRYFVVGEDAMKLVGITQKDAIVRPMKDGILNPSLKESTELLFYIIKAVVGDPIVANEPLRFSIPANPVDVDIDNVFHKMILSNYFKTMGYDPKPVNEAMCIAYDCNPVVKGEEGEIPLSGITISCGGGMSNIALMLKGYAADENMFSITKSGDYIDEQVSKVTGVVKSKVSKKKEKELHLDKPNHNDRTLSALSIYYGEYVNRISHLISQEFSKRGSEIQGEAEIVVAGGTSMPSGFCKIFEDAIKASGLSIPIYRVRQSNTPFYSVAQGASLRAQADYSKSLKKA